MPELPDITVYIDAMNPDCNTRIQRIVYAENETNYCPKCQANGKILADRSMSRLLKQDWPRRIETSDSE
jgi:formamidopyrimidine-DNA glycosylase